MLIKRILTAIIGVLIAIYVVNYGQWLFALAIYLLALLAWHEFCLMFQYKKTPLWYSGGMVSIILLLGCAWLGNSQETMLVITVATLLVIGKTVVSFGKFSIVNAAITLLGILYIGLPFAHLLLLRFTEQSVYLNTSLGMLSAGAAYLWLAFVGTWANDTAAFFVGSKFGRHKLCPAVSPGKTREGAVGGVVGSMVAILFLGMLFQIPFIHSVLIGFMVGIIAPFGDLAESVIKRYAGVKDSGNILPGHGGILDRFDSIMFVVPVVYYYLQAFLLY